ncbi:MAG TPA: hypothetical protein VK683_08660 [Rhizomicrobium sp.]|nr:hypothetical protein [Rhizomicrobium sp.]
MRIWTVAILLPLTISAALAQGWQEYRYPDLGFSVSFPGEPKITDGTAKASDGAAVTEKVFSFSGDRGDFRVTVTDYSNSSIADDAAISQAADKLRGTGDVLVDVSARVNRNYGRELSVSAKDGNRLVAAVFFVDRKLYVLEGRVRADTPDATRFQQSLNFLGGFGGFGRRGFRF